MEDYVRKLALWHTKTFKPIMTHEELEPIMSTLGFVAQPPSQAVGSGSPWKEYTFSAFVCQKQGSGEALEPPPRPRLPFPRIDGLHVYTYRAFFDAVGHFLGKRDIADHFHVRGMPLHRVHDLPFDKKFRRMNDEEGIYVYRDGTLDQATLMACNGSNSSVKNSSNSKNNSSSNGGNTTICLVPLKDIIVM